MHCIYYLYIYFIVWRHIFVKRNVARSAAPLRTAPRRATTPIVGAARP